MQKEGTFKGKPFKEKHMIFQGADPRMCWWEEPPVGRAPSTKWLLCSPWLLPSPRLFLAARGSVRTFTGRVKTTGTKAHAGNNHLSSFFLPRRDHPPPLPGLGAAAPTGGWLLAGKAFASRNACLCFLIVFYFRLKEFIFGSRNLTLATTFFFFFFSHPLGSAVKPARMKPRSSIPRLCHGPKQPRPDGMLGKPLPGRERGWELITLTSTPDDDDHSTHPAPCLAQSDKNSLPPQTALALPSYAAVAQLLVLMKHYVFLNDLLFHPNFHPNLVLVWVCLGFFCLVCFP